MTPDAAGLSTTLVDGSLRLEPLTEAHREPLRVACAADTEIWEIYFSNFSGDYFDANFQMLLTAPNREMLAVIANDRLVGMSGFINIAAQHRALEIGTSYLAPSARGTGINSRMKRLMIDHAFSCGFNRIEFRIDTRNARSQAAAAKIDAVLEGVLRQHLTTWNGYVRDSAIFSILKADWR